MHEEITDNRPRVVNYVFDFAENGIPAMKVSESIAEHFQTAFLVVKIISTNLETQEEIIDETIKIDISCLLFPKNKIDVSKIPLK